MGRRTVVCPACSAVAGSVRSCTYETRSAAYCIFFWLRPLHLEIDDGFVLAVDRLWMRVQAL